MYVDGQLISERQGFSLTIPNGTTKPRLIIGNLVYGRQSWQGDIYGLALYDYLMTKDQIVRHYKQWAEHENFSFAKKGNPYTLYLFAESNGTQSLDYGYGKNHLHIPKNTKVLNPKILAAPFQNLSVNQSLIEDSILNLFGFIPLGFFLL